MCGIIEEHRMSQMVVTTRTWFIWCHFSLPQVGIRTDQPWHAQPGLGRPPPATIRPVRARLLKLVRPIRCLLNLVWDDCLIIGGRGSGAALVRDGRCRGRCGRSCLDSYVRCCRGADKR